MKVYNVSHKGRVIKTFETEKEAQTFAVKFMHTQIETARALDFIDIFVEKSNLEQANMLIDYIRNKK